MGLQKNDAKSNALNDLKEIRKKASPPSRVLPAWILRLFGRYFPVDAYWYRAQFVIAAQAANDALKRNLDSLPRDQSSRDAWGIARTEAACLVLNVERALLVRTPRIAPELHRFLVDLEPSALILLAGVFVADARQTTVASGDLQDERYHALEMADSKTVDSDFLTAIVEELQRISPRAHYNLACYYSSKGLWLDSPKRSGRPAGTDEVKQSYRRSIHELDLALTGLDNRMRRSADTDPSLEGVKHDSATKDRFKALVSVRTQ